MRASATNRSSLEGVVSAVVRRAKDQGHVTPREIREALVKAGLPDRLWEDVVGLAGTALAARRGRYGFVPPGPERMRLRVQNDHRAQRAIQRAVGVLLGEKRRSQAADAHERRMHKRIDFVRPIEARTEGGAALMLFTRNISLSGIRLIGNCPLQGQKVQVWFPATGPRKPGAGFLVHILWASKIDEHLYENGGLFLETMAEPPRALRLSPRGTR